MTSLRTHVSRSCYCLVLIDKPSQKRFYVTVALGVDSLMMLLRKQQTEDDKYLLNDVRISRHFSKWSFYGSQQSI
ncbi:CLUMA_CG007513, isoform A [Clunio marinus]|uniref:CLUMA_CG007513, isoform A n=1 Tax=Clunio marinus TaxID=568069 RepID=A0A1J1I1A7_9DIPT|nr:CLUMA_CG007513, isoform A [Clunio marinus]